MRSAISSQTTPQNMSDACNGAAGAARLRVSAIALLMTMGCAGAQSSFRLVDTTFTPKASDEKPQVYLYADDVPSVAVRSVGIIEVTVPGSAGITTTIEAAAVKGQKVGCWALIEHSVYSHMQGHTMLPEALLPRVVLVHGGGGGSRQGQPVGPRVTERPEETTQFDCVVMDDKTRQS